jgi:hypothetical protein
VRPLLSVGIGSTPYNALDWHVIADTTREKQNPLYPSCP